MQVFKEFLKTTIMGGLFVLLPILLFFLLFREILELVVGLAMPIAGLFPKGTFDQAKFTVILALILLVGVSFLVGVAMRSSAGRRFWNRIERDTIGRLPLYNALKSIFTGFVAKKSGDAFRPALLKSPDGEEFAYLVEDHGNGRATVLMPWSPTPFAGSIKIVDMERVHLLDTNLGDFTMVLSHWGVGARKLIAPRSPSAAVKDQSSA